MEKTREREQAIVLRKQGKSIASIGDALNVSKSTVSVWCRDISLSKRATARLTNAGTNRSTTALLAYSEAKRLARQQKTKQNEEQGQITLGSLSKRDIYCVGLGLYWGEGYKQGNREFGFTNSDPKMLLFYIIWLKQVFAIKKSDLILRVSINALHTKRIKDVESYWSKITNVPTAQFTKPSLIKTTSRKIYSNHSTHFGTLRIKVRLGSDYREQTLGAIELLSTLHQTH